MSTHSTTQFLLNWRWAALTVTVPCREVGWEALDSAHTDRLTVLYTCMHLVSVSGPVCVNEGSGSWRIGTWGKCSNHWHSSTALEHRHRCVHTDTELPVLCWIEFFTTHHLNFLLQPLKKAERNHLKRWRHHLLWCYNQCRFVHLWLLCNIVDVHFVSLL